MIEEDKEMREEYCEVEEKFEEAFFKGVKELANKFVEGELKREDLLRCIRNLSEIYLEKKVPSRKEKG